jgi:predicted PurR-regulated permease PerM
MLSMLVMPMALLLEKWLHSRLMAAVGTLLAVLGAMSLTTLVFGVQLLRVAERAPDMVTMAAQQLAQRDPQAESLLRRSRNALHDLDRAADLAIGLAPVPRPNHRSVLPPAVPTSSVVPNNNITAGATVVLRDTAVSGSSVLLGLAANLSIVFFTTFFVLTGGKPLVRRFLNLWGYDASTYTHARLALRECSRQIRLYAGVLLVTNSIIGLVVWMAFELAGLPDAMGWGVTAAILHIVPYLGMAVLTVLGAAECFLVYESPGAALAMAGFLVVASTLIGTLITAWLQGRAARMNSATLFIGLVFWGALWGIWGLFLGPALVVLLHVVAAHSRAGARLAYLMQTDPGD